MEGGGWVKVSSLALRKGRKRALIYVCSYSERQPLIPIGLSAGGGRGWGREAFVARASIRPSSGARKTERVTVIERWKGEGGCPVSAEVAYPAVGSWPIPRRLDLKDRESSPQLTCSCVCTLTVHARLVELCCTRESEKERELGQLRSGSVSDLAPLPADALRTRIGHCYFY